MTYTVLGAAAAGLGNGIIAASPLQLAVSLLLALAALAGASLRSQPVCSRHCPRFPACGFLYAALASAAATGSAPAGAAAMAGFALGTVPSLVLVGIGGAAIASRWRGRARRLAAPLYLLNGTVLMVMAFSTLSSN